MWVERCALMFTMSPPSTISGGHMNTRTIAILAVVLVIIVILAIWVF